MSNLHGHQFVRARLQKDVLQPHLLFSCGEDGPDLNNSYTSRIDSNSLTVTGDILQNPEWFALPQQSIHADLCTPGHPPPTPKIGNPYWLTAILPAASWTSAAALSVICVCCVESVFRVHRETFNLAFVSLTSRRQVTLRRSALCSGIWRSRCVAFRGAWQLTSPSCG